MCLIFKARLYMHTFIAYINALYSSYTCIQWISYVYHYGNPLHNCVFIYGFRWVLLYSFFFLYFYTGFILDFIGTYHCMSHFWCDNTHAHILFHLWFTLLLMWFIHMFYAFIHTYFLWPCTNSNSFFRVGVTTCTSGPLSASPGLMHDVAGQRCVQIPSMVCPHTNALTLSITHAHYTSRSAARRLRCYLLNWGPPSYRRHSFSLRMRIMCLMRMPYISHHIWMRTHTEHRAFVYIVHNERLEFTCYYIFITHCTFLPVTSLIVFCG